MDFNTMDITLCNDIDLEKSVTNLNEKIYTNISKSRSIFTTNVDKNDLDNDCCVEDDIHTIGAFYTDMLERLKLLENSPILKSKPSMASLSSSKELMDNEKLYKNLKNRPDVKEKLKIIDDMNVEIESVIRDYKSERDQRLRTQIELCKNICKNNIFVEKDTHTFLDLCQFEFADEDENWEEGDNVEMEDEKMDIFVSSGVRKKNIDSFRKYPSTFVKRNIEVAKTGTLAGSSLTDEEKTRIELLLECEKDDEFPQFYGLVESCATDLESYSINGYSFLDEDIAKLFDIDRKLEKFRQYETKSEEKKEFSNNENKNEFYFEQALKHIDEKITLLKNQEKIDLEKVNISNQNEDLSETEFGNSMTNNLNYKKNNTDGVLAIINNQIEIDSLTGENWNITNYDDIDYQLPDNYAGTEDEESNSIVSSMDAIDIENNANILERENKNIPTLTINDDNDIE